MNVQNENKNDRLHAALAAETRAEMGPHTESATERTKRLTTVAMLSAVAYLLVFLSHMVPIKVEGFLNYDPSDIVTVIGGFLLGPLTALLISFVVSFVEFITVSSTGVIGLIMNILSTVSFACVAAFIYKKKQTRFVAVVALLSGTLAMTVVMLLWNYIITPLYMAVPRAQVAGMLLTVFLPFNLLKGALNAAVTLLLYKPLVTALRRARFIAPARIGAPDLKRPPGRAAIVLIPALAAVVLLTCVLFLLAWTGVL
ncbi:MAG: ECF transporter S component [Clostridiales Family XIII bacterium]|jgi:riboflavin transporter FmnP|nr:ECF transporter S component [Clostridiales Family XIII bacterium]